MTDDKKLPLPYEAPTSATARETYLTSPVSGRSLLGRAVSRFIARLNTKTVEANTEEVSALKAYAQEKGALADAMLDAERRIANYLEHRDDLISDDHEAHLDRMAENKFDRELNRRRRENSLRAFDAADNRAASQGAFDARIAEQTNEAALSQAKWQAAKAQWGLDAFQQSIPLRKDRLQHLYTSGALDQEIEMLITEASRDEQRRRNRDAGTRDAVETSKSPDGAAVDQLILELNQEIDLAKAKHASEVELAVLYTFLARLSARRASLRDGA